jgi:RND family efflux transporter MFP subunit
MALILRALVAVAILGGGCWGYVALSVEQEAVKRPEGKARLIKTRVEELRVGSYNTMIRTQGIVRPHNEVALTAEVSGKILRLLPGFEDGAFFSKDDVLLELDPANYETAVTVAKAQVARALTVHEREKAQARQARLNWQDLGYTEEPNELVLRLPQLREAQANVDAANAQLARAERDLAHTKVRASFDGRVRRRMVGLGQSISPGTQLGTVFSIDFAEVRLPIAGRDMAFLSLPEDPEDPPVDVELRDILNDDNETTWKGTIVRTEGALDANSLELFAIARIDDPFGRKSGHPPLRIGQPVAGFVPGRVLENVIVVPRMAIRQLNRIYLVDKDTLTLEGRKIEPIYSDEDYVIIRDPTIAAGSLLSTTHLVYAPDGSKVEILPDPNAEKPETTDSDSSDDTTKTAQVPRG